MTSLGLDRTSIHLHRLTEEFAGQKRDPQRNLQDLKPNGSRARQLAEIDRILDAHPERCDLVADDLAPHRAPQKLPSRAGAKGLTAEPVLRVAILKPRKQWAYRVPWDVIDDSERLRSFCRFGDRKIPMFNTLAENVKRIRVATRLRVGCREAFPHVAWSFANHTRRAKRRAFKIANTSKASVRTAAYRDLLKVGQQGLEDGRPVRTPLTHLVSAHIQQRRRRFRAGIEGVISAPKRAYGLDRCSWRGWDGFQRSVWSAIVAWNLQVLARHLLA